MSNFGIVDIAIVSVALVSIIIGFIRGVTKEILSLLSWGGSIFLTIMSFSWASGVARLYIKHGLIADFVTICVLFILFLTLISILNYVFSGFIKKSMLKGIDSFFGGVFGVIRGILILVVLEMTFTQYIWTEVTPELLVESKLRPLVMKSASFVLLILPEKYQQIIISQMNQLNKDNIQKFLIKEFSGSIPELGTFTPGVTISKVESFDKKGQNVFDLPEEKTDSEVMKDAEDLATLKPRKIESTDGKTNEKESKKGRFDLDRLIDQNMDIDQ